jgi:RNA polymerase sigma-70 factor (ECF subfamily)
VTEFERIYREHFDTVYGFLMRLCRSAPLAEELAQETFFRALRSIGKFDGRCRVDVWLCQIAKNSYYSHQRQTRHLISGPDFPADTPDPDADPESSLSSREDAAQIRAQLHTLPEPYKEVFMWRVLAELSFLQIGQLFGKSANWACVTFHRAKAMIQNRLEVENREK